MPAYVELAARSRLYRLPIPEKVETPEARWLGMRPSEANLRQGPLTVAALGADPPPKSLHFHLSLASVVDGFVAKAEAPPSVEEVRRVLGVVSKLNTNKLTFVGGNSVDHGLVWEALGDLSTTSLQTALGSPLKSVLPEGDGERLLRQYIDDSVNLLDDMEVNQRRRDEGLSPINVLWPWGHGVRTPVPNLALRHGGPAVVTSTSLRLAGLTRLAGYRHGDLTWLGSGVHTKLREAIEVHFRADRSVLVIDAIAELRATGELDEAAFVARRIAEELVRPMFDRATTEPSQLILAAPAQDSTGLAISFDSEVKLDSNYPFDDRALDEAKVSTCDLEELVDEALMSAHAN